MKEEAEAWSKLFLLVFSAVDPLAWFTIASQSLLTRPRLKVHNNRYHRLKITQTTIMQFFDILAAAATAVAIMSNTAVAGPVNLQEVRSNDQQLHPYRCKFEVLHIWYTEPFLSSFIDPGQRAEITIEARARKTDFAIDIDGECKGTKVKGAGRIPENWFIRLSREGSKEVQFINDKPKNNRVSGGS